MKRGLNVGPSVQAVVRGQQASRWLCSFLEVRRRLQVKPYLEDDRQLDQVYLYLKELFHRVTDQAPCLANVKFMDDVRFVLDVLLPEVRLLTPRPGGNLYHSQINKRISHVIALIPMIKNVDRLVISLEQFIIPDVTSTHHAPLS